jgi:hypothetical protein
MALTEPFSGGGGGGGPCCAISELGTKLKSANARAGRYFERMIYLDRAADREFTYPQLLLRSSRNRHAPNISTVGRELIISVTRAGLRVTKTFPMKLNTGDRHQAAKTVPRSPSFRLISQCHKVRRDERSGCKVFFVNTLINLQKCRCYWFQKSQSDCLSQFSISERYPLVSDNSIPSRRTTI